MEAVTDFILLGSKISVDCDCSHKIKRHLLLGRIAMTNLDSVLKSRGITLPTKVHLVKAMVFPLVMCGCESWTIKKAECRRIDAFELCCWRRLFFFFFFNPFIYFNWRLVTLQYCGGLLRVPWTTMGSNQSILKEISPEYSLEGLMLKLKLRYLAT